MNNFPKNFIWGTATSSHQVEGGNAANDWSQWEDEGRIKTPSGPACDHYRKFREDFDLARSLGHNAHRFSIEWSRIEPEEGERSEAAVAHYRDVVRALRERNIEPVVTLHHFTLPRWIARMGGWSEPDTVEHFARYVTSVSDALGSDVRYWVTINEPMVLIFKGYLEGTWPPGAHSTALACRAVRHILTAHGRAYRILHERRRNCWVGLAKHLRVFDPYVPFMPTDWLSVAVRRFFFNHFALRATTKGFPGLMTGRMPWLKEISGTADFIGVNYYSRDIVQFLPGSLIGVDKKKPLGGDVEERNSLGWEIYPDGFYRVLKSLKRYRLPVWVVENGVATTQDERRKVFIRKHLRAMRRAMDEGVDVRGYFHWSLLDNFEWADGYEPRFGLVETDYATQARRPKPSAEFFAEICRTGNIPS